MLQGRLGLMVPSVGHNWVVVKIMVPFWVPIIQGAQKGTIILTTTQLL